MKKLLVLGLLLALGFVLMGQETTSSLSELKEEVKVEAQELFTHVDSAWKNWSTLRKQLIAQKIHILKKRFDGTLYAVAYDGKLYDLHKDGDYSFRKPTMAGLTEEEALRQFRKIMEETQNAILSVMKSEEQQLVVNQEK